MHFVVCVDIKASSLSFADTARLRRRELLGSTELSLTVVCLARPSLIVYTCSIVVSLGLSYIIRACLRGERLRMVHRLQSATTSITVVV